MIDDYESIVTEKNEETSEKQKSEPMIDKDSSFNANSDSDNFS